MNKISCLFCFLSAYFFMHAQDTLLTNKGSLITGVIVEQSEGYIAVKESNKDEISMIINNDLLIVKKANEKPLILFKNDTLISKSGRIFLAKVIIIDKEWVTYVNAHASTIKINQYPIAELFMVKLSDGSMVNFTQDMPTTSANSSLLGTNDAKMYYNPPKGLVVGEFFLGLTSIYILPIIPGLIIATKTPTVLDNPQNPNNFQLYKDPVYKDAYAKQAKIQKKKKAIPSFLAGISASILGLILINL